ncbi:hypothetical protein Tco_0032784 [Tanacetum coccineum]
MVTVPIHQDTSSVPLITTPVIDLTVYQPVPTAVQAPLPTLTATATATTTLLLPPPLQQGSSDSILIQGIEADMKRDFHTACGNPITLPRFGRFQNARMKKKRDDASPKKHKPGYSLISHLLPSIPEVHLRNPGAFWASRASRSSHSSSIPPLFQQPECLSLQARGSKALQSTALPAYILQLWEVQFRSDFVFNKDLSIIRFGSQEWRPAIVNFEDEVSYYPDVVLEQMVPSDVALERNQTVRTHMRILSVVRIEVFSLYGYDYMKKIVLRRADLKEYTIAEMRTFKFRSLSDFELFQLFGIFKCHPGTSTT